MCGIFGIVDWSGSNTKSELENIISNSLESISHRGPDDAGMKVIESNGTLVGFGHKRLSIIDLSASGKQPMESVCGRFLISYNGEIYNHLYLRSKVQKINPNFIWRGHSDTESLLASLTIFGINETIEDLSGMFAIAIYDRLFNKLILIRDRMGEKPIYYGIFGKKLIFGSEISVFKKINYLQLKINMNAVSDLLRVGYVPDPKSIYTDIQKIPAASVFSFSVCDGKINNELKKYWSPNENLNQNYLISRFSNHEKIEYLNNLIFESIKEQMVSDVPVGCFLSGGIDSSLVASIMQKNSNLAINTFSIGFDNKSFDEAVDAKRIANFIGTNHTELYVNSDNMLDVVNSLPKLYSEPFADSSQIPTYLVCMLAKKNISVALSGDGGDELFGGYSHYKNLPKLWNLLDNIPYQLRCILHKLDKIPNIQDKYRNIIKAIDARNFRDFYFKYSSKWVNPSELFIDKNISTDYDFRTDIEFSNLIEKGMMDIDIASYLVGDILVKVDRASMANSLETRIPLLNKNIVEFSSQIPINMKLNASASKWILRQVLYKHVPRELLERPKKGFSVPLSDWLRGPLKEWAHSLLNEDLIKLQGYFDSKVISNVWIAHIKGERDNSAKLWNLLMFQSWLQFQKP